MVICYMKVQQMHFLLAEKKIEGNIQILDMCYNTIKAS